jgi:hypothetical protein
MLSVTVLRPRKYRDLKSSILTMSHDDLQSVLEFLFEGLCVNLVPSVVYTSLTYTVALPFQHLTHPQIQLINEHSHKKP